MKKEQFENRLRALLPKVTDEAVTAWTKYAEELDQDEVEAEDLFYDENYIELSLVKQHYGEEITTRLFNYGTQFTFNYFELHGAARKLADDWPLDDIAKYTLENGGSATMEEHEEFAAALRKFQTSEQESFGMRMK